MYIWNKCRPTVYCRHRCSSISCGWAMVPRWIWTVAGRVDPPPKVSLKWRHWLIRKQVTRNDRWQFQCCCAWLSPTCTSESTRSASPARGLQPLSTSMPPGRAHLLQSTCRHLNELSINSRHAASHHVECSKVAFNTNNGVTLTVIGCTSFRRLQY